MEKLPKTIQTIKTMLVSKDQLKQDKVQFSKLSSLSTLFYSSWNIFEHHINNIGK